MEQRVVVTGIGVASPIGVGVEAFAASLARGRVGLRRGTTQQRRSGLSVVGMTLGVVGADYLQHVRHGRVLNRPFELVVAAAALLARDAGIGSRPVPEESLGVALAIGVLDHELEAAPDDDVTGERHRLDDPEGTSATTLPSIADPLRRLRHLPNIAAAIVSIEHHAGGPNLTFVGDCATGLEPILEGYWAIKTGEADGVICGGVESCLRPPVLGCVAGATVLSPSASPRSACRPFDADSEGTVMSEGAALLLLESAGAAAKRGAVPYAEILGGASSGGVDGACDESMELIRRLDCGDLDVIFGHGDGVVASDTKEADAIAAVFPGARDGKPSVTSIKGHMGHTIRAAGAFNAAACCVGMKNGFIPAIRRIDRSVGDLRYIVGNTARTAHVNRALVNAISLDRRHSASVVIQQCG